MQSRPRPRLEKREPWQLRPPSQLRRRAIAIRSRAASAPEPSHWCVRPAAPLPGRASPRREPRSACAGSPPASCETEVRPWRLCLQRGRRFDRQAPGQALRGCCAGMPRSFLALAPVGTSSTARRSLFRLRLRLVPRQLRFFPHHQIASHSRQGREEAARPPPLDVAILFVWD